MFQFVYGVTHRDIMRVDRVSPMSDSPDMFIFYFAFIELIVIIYFVYKNLW